MNRREFITLLGGAAAAVLVRIAAGAERGLPVVGFLSARSAEESAHLVAAFRRGLAEQGLGEGEHVTIAFHWANGHYEVLPSQAADFARQSVSVMVAVGGDMTARAAISATQAIPIVAVFIGDPVAAGLA